MGVFDNNISKPLSITAIGKDIRESCARYLKEKARLYNKYGSFIPTSTNCERDLREVIQTNFQQRLEDAGATSWRVAVIKKTYGNAHTAFYIAFHWWDVYEECRKLFDCEYEII